MDDAKHQRRLLVDRVFCEFDASGEWPLVEELRHKLDLEDDDLDVIEVGRTLDPMLGRVDPDHGGRATLTIHGISAAAGGQEVLNDCLAAVQLAYRRFREGGPGTTVMGADLEEELGLTTIRSQKLRQLLGSVPGLGGGGSNGDDWHRAVSSDITRFKRVTTLGEFLALIPRARLLNLGPPQAGPLAGGDDPTIGGATLTASAANLLARLRGLREPIGDGPQPFEVTHRGGGVARISHFSIDGWWDESELDVGQLEVANVLIPARGGRPNSFFALPGVAAASSDPPRRQERALLGLDRRPILVADDIDSFAAIKSVSAKDVQDLVDKGFFEAAEDEVQRVLESILDVPEHQMDWGGEQDDMFTANLMYQGVRRPSTFLLKGPGIGKRVLTLRYLGSQGDQLQRLFTVPAEVFVVQSVGPVDKAVRTELELLVTSARHQGRSAIGCVMDGQDTARLLRAFGFR